MKEVEYEIKPMETDEEIRGRGYVHWKSWQETYTGLIDAEYLKSRTLEECVETAFRRSGSTLVARDGQAVTGFVSYGPCRDEAMPGAGEIFALYVLADHQGRGVGRALMEAALERLDGLDPIVLWVLKGNTRAEGFYRHMGFEADAEAPILLGTPNTEKRMRLRRR